MFTIDGGNPEWRSTAGILVPGVMAAKAACPPKWAADAVEAKVAVKKLRSFMVLRYVYQLKQ